jgi:hypothetical protein
MTRTTKSLSVLVTLGLLGATGCGADAGDAETGGDVAQTEQAQLTATPAYGGPGGTAFTSHGGNYYAADVRSGSWIDGISLKYKNEFGQSFTQGPYGTSTGGTDNGWKTCPTNQFLVGMYGSYIPNDMVYQLGFICGTLDRSKTTNLPLYGSKPGSSAKSFTALCPKSTIVKNVVGRSGWYLDQIQLYCDFMDIVIY